MIRSFLISAFFVSLCLWTGCTSVRPATEIIPEQIDKKAVIIFVPGYYGTALADAETGERLHLTLGQAIFGGPSLAINFDKLNIPGAVSIRTDGVLDKLTILPGIYSIDIYGEAMDFLNEAFPGRVVTFSYDWRDSDVKTAKELGALVKKVRKAGASKIAIVAHSNGGVVTSYYLRYGVQSLESAKETWAGAKQIDGVVLVGTPFSGTVTAFYNMQNGVSFGLSKAPLSSITMASFPSSYELLPPESQNAFLNSEGKSLGRGVYLPQSWERHGWGLFKTDRELTAETQSKRSDYLKSKLKAGRLFSQRMLAKSKIVLKTKRPALVVIGIGARTLQKAKWSAPTLKEEGEWSYSDKSLYVDGDGTITRQSATPPEALRKSLHFEKTLAKVVHTEMFSHVEVQDSIKAFLVRKGF